MRRLTRTAFPPDPFPHVQLSNTWYPASYVAEIKMSEMELDVGVGRGYRFYTGTPVFPFGFGLALTNFSLAIASGPVDGIAFAAEAAPSSTATFVVRVTNTGSRVGDEVVQAYFEPVATPSQPASRLRRQLFAYERVHLAPGAVADVTIAVTSSTLRLVDKASGDVVSTPGDFSLLFTNGAGVNTPRVRATVRGDEVVAVAFPGGPA